MTSSAHPPTARHNWEPLLVHAVQTYIVAHPQPNIAISVRVGHNTWCDLHNDCGFCNCAPTIIIDERECIALEEPA